MDRRPVGHRSHWPKGPQRRGTKYPPLYTNTGRGARSRIGGGLTVSRAKGPKGPVGHERPRIWWSGDAGSSKNCASTTPAKRVFQFWCQGERGQAGCTGHVPALAVCLCLCTVAGRRRGLIVLPGRPSCLPRIAGMRDAMVSFAGSQTPVRCARGCRVAGMAPSAVKSGMAWRTQFRQKVSLP